MPTPGWSTVNCFMRSRITWLQSPYPAQGRNPRGIVSGPAAAGLASVNAAGGAVVVEIEYAIRGATPSVFPQSKAAVDASGMKVVPIGTASVITNVNAEAEE